MNIMWPCCVREFGGLLDIKIKERLQAMISLHGSASNLVRDMDQLRSYRKDKEDAVIAEEKKNYRLKRKAVVDGWLRSVDELEEKVAKFDLYLNGGGEASSSRNGANAYQAGDRGGCSCFLCSMLGRWGGRFCVLVKLSGEVADLIGEVRDLRKEGQEMKELVKEVEGNMESCDIEMVGEGAREALANIHKYLDDDNVGIIGIYGMGGVGKSSLLKTIKHEYTHARQLEFARVIWAEVIRFVDIDKLQEDPGKGVVDIERLRNSIGKDLPRSSAGWSAESLKEALRGGRFLLLLENVWERLDLDLIGIPTPDPYNRCKIVFATRSDAVRNDMDAAGVKLGRLTQEEAFELFRRQLNNDHLLASCRDHAKMIVQECHGLPLALIVMARVMRNKHFKSDWLDTIEALKDPRTMFSDSILGEESVFKILGYSYYHLKDDLRPCLLYCALFDKSTSIDREEIIDYWIGEGFFDRDGEPPDMRRSRMKGRDVINQLVSACLLELSSNEDGKVKMHGLIHDMAIKIAAHEFLVYPDTMTKGEQKGENWELAKRISRSKVSKLPTKSCPKLVTLLLKNCDGLTKIPKKFFNDMPALCVLDLSNTGVEELPRGIINLKQLRHMNLSHTKIKSLPVEVRALDKLNQLNLSFTLDLEEIPYEAISGHAQLRTLNLFKSKYRSWVWNASDPARGVSLSDLEALENLQELSLNIIEHRDFVDLLQSGVAQSTVCLYLEGFQGIAPETRFDALEELRELYISNDMELEKLVFKRTWLLNLEVLTLSSLSVADVSLCEEERSARMTKLRLSRVVIYKCNNLEDLSWVRHLGCIQTLSVRRCRKLKVVIAGGDGGHAGDQLCFNSLRSITLAGLPELERFCECRMEMSSMPSITVDDCPKLTGEFVYYGEDRKQKKISYLACQKPVNQA